MPGVGNSVQAVSASSLKLRSRPTCTRSPAAARHSMSEGRRMADG